MALKKTAAKKSATKTAAKKASSPKSTKTAVKKKTVIKSGEDGQFVSKVAAKKDPKGTMAMRVAVDNTPGINEAALKRAAKAKKETAKSAAPAKKTATVAKKTTTPTPKKEQTFALADAAPIRTAAQVAAAVPSLAAPKKVATKKAAKHVAAPTFKTADAPKKDWRQNESNPTKAFGQTHGSLTSAALAAHVSPETMQARTVSKDLEFDHAKYQASKNK